MLLASRTHALIRPHVPPQDVQAGAVSAQCPKQPTGFRHASYSPASTQDDAASPSEAAPPLKKQAVAGVNAGLNGGLLPGGLSGLGDNAPGAMSAASMMGQLTGLDAVVAASVARLATADQTNDMGMGMGMAGSMGI